MVDPDITENIIRLIAKEMDSRMNLFTQIYCAIKGYKLIPDAALSRAKLSKVDLKWIILSSATLIEADLEGADMICAYLQGANLSYA